MTKKAIVALTLPLMTGKNKCYNQKGGRGAIWECISYLASLAGESVEGRRNSSGGVDTVE